MSLDPPLPHTHSRPLVTSGVAIGHLSDRHRGADVTTRTPMCNIRTQLHPPIAIPARCAARRCRAANRLPAPTMRGWECRRAGVLTARDRQADDVSTHPPGEVEHGPAQADCHRLSPSGWGEVLGGGLDGFVVRSYDCGGIANLASRASMARSTARCLAGRCCSRRLDRRRAGRRPPSPVGQGGGGHRRWRTEKTAPSGSLSTATRPTSARSNGATDTEPPSWPTRPTISSMSATAK